MCGICCICAVAPVTQCPLLDMDHVSCNSFIGCRGPDVHQSVRCTLWSDVQALFAGCVLHLRGALTPQPLTNKDGDLLLWNGEIFDGIQVAEEENDTKVLFSRLVRCKSDDDVLTTMQAIKGPWAFIFWQTRWKRLWFGRDVFGRRSLLWHLPTEDDPIFSLASVPVKPLEYEEVPSVGVFCLESSHSCSNGERPEYEGAGCRMTQDTSAPFTLHLYPWQRAVWPGSDSEVCSNSAGKVVEMLGLKEGWLRVSMHADLSLPSFMPVLCDDIPNQADLPPVFDQAANSAEPLHILQAIEREGELSSLVTRLQEVLQAAVSKRVHNLPRLCHQRKEDDRNASALTEKDKFVPEGCVNNTDLCLSVDLPVNLNIHEVSVKDSVSDDIGCVSSSNSVSRIGRNLISAVETCTEQQPSYQTGLQAASSSTDLPHSTSSDAPQTCGTNPLVKGRHEELSEKVLVKGMEELGLKPNHADSVVRQVQETGSFDGFDAECHSVEKTVCDLSPLGSSSRAYVGILFSGGLDSTVLASLTDSCLPPEEPIDLINVAFEQKVPQQPRKKKGVPSGDCATRASSYDVPDRLSGLSALAELNPNRQWNFVEVNVTLEMLQEQRSRRVRHLVYPLTTVLDDSIGCAVWFAAQGRGTLGNGPHKGADYTSTARVILCGMGADEQLAGYSRHRVRFQQESWAGLIQEINMEMHRISARNLGRDDRIIADHGKESRFPFLDEDVVAFLAGLPIQKKADLRLGRGLGEKLLLRLLALRLGLPTTATLPKRAIQFGSRIAKLEKSKEKGSHVCHRLVQE